MIKKHFKNLTTRIFLMEFINDFVLIYPLYTIMFGERSNISAAGIGILLATWQIVSVAAEVPTGIIADKMSKKTALLLSKTLRMVAFAFWLFMPNFAGYMTGFILWGISDAFSSGTFQAYLYESLSEEHKQQFSKIYSRASSMSMLSYTLAYILTFYIGAHYNFLLSMSILVSLISALICLTLPDIKVATKDTKVKPQILKLALETISKQKILKELFVGAIIIQCLAVVLIEYIPVYYHQVGAPVDFVPLLLALGNAITVVLFWSMHRFEKQLVDYRLPIIGLTTLIFILSFGHGTLVAITGMLIFVRIIRLIVVNNESAIQHLAVSEARATIGSIYSFIARILAAGVILCIGFYTTSDSSIWPIRIASLLIIMAFLGSQLFYMLQKNK